MLTHFQSSKGFALLFTVLTVSLILALTLTIADISYRQTVLSGLAKDSQIAFFQADAGLECGLYYDIAQNAFPIPTSSDAAMQYAPDGIICGSHTLVLSEGESRDDYIVYTEKTPTVAPCTKIIFDKTDPANRIIEAHGYNICTTNTRQVERTLRVLY